MCIFSLLDFHQDIFASTFTGGTTTGPSGLVLVDHKLTGKLKFQECSDTTCKIPQQVAFEIPIKVEAMVPGLKK